MAYTFWSKKWSKRTWNIDLIQLQLILVSIDLHKFSSFVLDVNSILNLHHCVRNVAHLPRTCTRGWCMVGLAFRLFGENLLWRDNGRQEFDVTCPLLVGLEKVSGLLMSVSTFWDLYALICIISPNCPYLFLLSNSRIHDVKGWLGLAVGDSKYLIHIDFCWLLNT